MGPARANCLDPRQGLTELRAGRRVHRAQLNRPAGFRASDGAPRQHLAQFSPKWDGSLSPRAQGREDHAPQGE
jgi:hypothetical protein